MAKNVSLLLSLPWERVDDVGVDGDEVFESLIWLEEWSQDGGKVSLGQNAVEKGKGFLAVISGEEEGQCKQPIKTRYLGHVTGYQPIRDQFFLIRQVPAQFLLLPDKGLSEVVYAKGKDLL